MLVPCRGVGVRRRVRLRALVVWQAMQTMTPEQRESYGRWFSSMTAEKHARGAVVQYVFDGDIVGQVHVNAHGETYGNVEPVGHCDDDPSLCESNR